MNPSSSGPTAAATLRPRLNKRNLTGFEDFSQPEAASAPPFVSGNPTTPGGSPSPTRAPSPIPSTHPSRASSARPTTRDRSYPGLSPGKYGDRLEPGNELAASLSGLWGRSWTSLQGLANNVLGNEASEELFKDKASRRSGKLPSSASSQPQWGPSNNETSQPGAGSKEERVAMMRARKRQELLMGAATFSSEPSSYKRRTSDDFDLSTSAPPGHHDDRDALVYIHPVQREDTLAGLSIKYNCQLAAIKQSNRMWSNDAVQTRKVILVPVDACGIKGRVVTSPEIPSIALSGSSESTSRVPQSRSEIQESNKEVSSAPPFAPASFPAANGALLSPRLGDSEEPLWKHDSWVQLDFQPKVVEIARLPRRDLGYFPRARRKSKSYSDIDSPTASLELPRPSISVSDVSTLSRDPSHRKRGSSGSDRWAQYLTGPGGVGSLGGRGASAPGPKTDKFTKAVAKHVPSMVLPAQPLEEDYEEPTFGNNLGNNLEQLGGQIEGWVKKLAKSAARVVEQPSSAMSSPRLGRSRPVYPTDETGRGDLIELSNAFEIGDEEDDERAEEHQRGRLRPVTSATDIGSRRATSSRSIRSTFSWDDRSKRKGD